MNHEKRKKLDKFDVLKNECSLLRTAWASPVALKSFMAAGRINLLQFFIDKI
jgi:hypothetical protein